MNTQLLTTNSRELTRLRTFAADRFDELRDASIDGTGITREAFGPRETVAHELIAKAATTSGLSVTYDPVRNLIITLPGDEPDQPFVACGSHLDSVPQGGNFDGAAGVVACLTALVYIKKIGLVPPRTIKLFALRGEESAWFGKSWIGSNAMFGFLTKTDLERRRFDREKTLGEYMTDVGADVKAIALGTQFLQPERVAAFLELHIEQGPVLVAQKLPVGVVTAIHGNLRHMEIHCYGESAHAGTTLREFRHDAVVSVSDLVLRTDTHWRNYLDQGHDIVVTHGMLATNPTRHAISKVADEVCFSLDIRSSSLKTLEDFYASIKRECRAIEAERGVRFLFDDSILNKPAPMAKPWVEHLAQICERQKVPYMRIPSGGGHDSAVFNHAGIPTAMLFIRNPHGSHNPNEAMDLDDFMIATSILIEALQEPIL